MKQKKHYEYACDECDFRSIVLETTGNVKFKDVVNKATARGWKLNDAGELICPSCIELDTGETFNFEHIVAKPSKYKVIVGVFLLLGLGVLAISFINNNQNNFKEKIVQIAGKIDLVEEIIDIEPEFADQIAQDPEKFVARHEAIPANEDFLVDATKLASIVAKTATEIAKEIKIQNEEQDAEPKISDITTEKIESIPPPLETPPSPDLNRNPKTHGEFAVFSGIVNHNLTQAAQKIGLNFSHVKKIISIFSYTVNFRRLAKGDKFTVIFDKTDFANNGSKAKILAAEFRTRGKIQQRVYFTNNSGKSSYYLLTSKGPSKTISKIKAGSEKGFLRYPLHYKRVSSNFNLRRRHPISGRIRPHRGTDFAAPLGTKVWSTANGVVKTAGWQKGFGWVVIISHQGRRYSTVYAHLQRIARGIKRGVKVRRKQTIGYVGSSGSSTGNHLHYEFRVKGHAVNPLRVRLPAASKIIAVKITDPAEQKRFKDQATIMATELKFSRLQIESL